MNLDEIIKIIGPTNSPIAIGGYNSDDFDTDCNIHNLVIFDGKDTSDEIIEFFLNFIKKNNLSLVYVTHNSKYAEMADFQYELKNKTLLKK